MKKLLLVLLGMFSLQVFAASPAKELTLHIQFDAQPSGVFFDKPLHVDKIIKINSESKNNIVMTQSKVSDNSPVTLVLMVQPVAVENDQLTLQFSLVNYGFNQPKSVITRPKVVVLNGQQAE